MSNPPEVHDANEAAPPGGPPTRYELELRREAVTQAAANRPGFDVALLDKADFEAGLRLITTRRQRLQRIIDTMLVEGVHYLQKDEKGRKIFPKPHLTIAGASELRRQFRLTCRNMEPPVILSSEESVSVSVTRGCYDSAGRLLGTRDGGCNTLERRFKSRDGKTWTYDDPREALHQCIAMAQKRADTLVTKEVTGADAFFAAEDLMDAALEETAPQVCSDEDSQRIKELARAKGIRTNETWRAVKLEFLGHEEIYTTDVEKLIAGLNSMEIKTEAPPERGRAVKDEGYGDERPPEGQAKTAPPDLTPASSEEVKSFLDELGAPLTQKEIAVYTEAVSHGVTRSDLFDLTQTVREAKLERATKKTK